MLFLLVLCPSLVLVFDYFVKKIVIFCSIKIPNWIWHTTSCHRFKFWWIFNYLKTLNFAYRNINEKSSKLAHFFPHFVRLPALLSKWTILGGEYSNLKYFQWKKSIVASWIHSTFNDNHQRKTMEDELNACEHAVLCILYPHVLKNKNEMLKIYTLSLRKLSFLCSDKLILQHFQSLVLYTFQSLDVIFACVYFVWRNKKMLFEEFFKIDEYFLFHI